MAADSLESLLEALEERASTARTIFMLLDSDADGLVAVEQVSVTRAVCVACFARALCISVPSVPAAERHAHFDATIAIAQL